MAGGHTFGKTHGAGPADHVGNDPEAASWRRQGLGWKSTHGTGKGADAITSGLEVTWTTTPTQWSNGFFKNLFEYEYELTQSPAAPTSGWPRTPRRSSRRARPVEEHRPDDAHHDLSLRFDPIYEPISRRFTKPGGIRDAFAAPGTS
nr:peroxidase family protein [Streptomyces sp. F001]